MTIEGFDDEGVGEMNGADDGVHVVEPVLAQWRDEQIEIQLRRGFVDNRDRAHCLRIRHSRRKGETDLHRFPIESNHRLRFIFLEDGQMLIDKMGISFDVLFLGQAGVRL